MSSSDEILAFNKYHTVKIVNKYEIQGYLLHSKTYREVKEGLVATRHITS